MQLRCGSSTTAGLAAVSVLSIVVSCQRWKGTSTAATEQRQWLAGASVLSSASMACGGARTRQHALDGAPQQGLQ